MNILTDHDLQWALLKCPRKLIEIMKRREWAGKVFVGGGFLRSIVAGEPINDVDVFVKNTADANKLAMAISGCSPESFNHSASRKRDGIFSTDNAHTITNVLPRVQIIHRWNFESPVAVASSFDFTVCCAVFWRAAGNDDWRSHCDDRFYADVASRRLFYRAPVRNEDAGGSALRILKYYQKGYRIPLDSFAAVLARMVLGVESEVLEKRNEKEIAKIFTGLLREVDPDIDPSHIAHLPAEKVRSSGGAEVE